MFDVSHIVATGGLLLIAIFLFAEVGLFLGFFLPGDTLLIAAGIYAKQGKLSVAALIVVAALAAIAGDSLAYYFGRKLGPRVFTKDDGLIFRKDHIDRAEKVYERFGSKALLVTHFFPVVRTFMPLLAGVARMPYKRFLTFDTIGDTFWAASVTLIGYYVGSRIPNVDNYILLVLGIVVICSLAPALYHFIRVQTRTHRQKTK